MHVTVTEATEFIDRTLQTASWYDRWLIQPGTYQIHGVDISHNPVPEGGTPYYWKVTLDAILVYSYRVNRVFTASSSTHDYPNRPGFVRRHMYAYEAVVAGESFLGIGEVGGEDCTGRCDHGLNGRECYSDEYHWKHQADKAAEQAPPETPGRHR